jgi:hypothetical protein
LFILAIRSPQTKQKYLQRFGYFLNFAQVAMERGTSIEELCSKLAELAKSDYKWLTNCIFSYLQLLKTRVESKEIKASTLRNNIKPIKLFCEQLDIDTPWKKLMHEMPRERKYAKVLTNIVLIVFIAIFFIVSLHNISNTGYVKQPSSH